MVFDKRKVWPALALTAFINTNYAFFQRRLFGGDKMTFAFAFNATHTQYAISRKHPYSVGRAATLDNDKLDKNNKGNSGSKHSKDGKLYFCGNTLAQRHPVTGDIMFMHRGGAK